ncbi:MAG: PCRF domain-containing protein [Candidatus Harrisonbacteria bacterium]|nr:PCRF domain-containing protein [Candidatus Harrisonbacteria bacterium]
MFKALSGKYDQGPAHLTIYAGVGGEDAKDWANMLFRMYFKYVQKRGWKVVATEDRGMEIRGDFTYGTLKNEMGVHRLVRISPFSAKKLRHTSFALVEVVPIFQDIEHRDVVIPPEDLKIETSRSSGPGGQNVNKRETAVRIVHLPTGIAAASQSERSQPQNKEKAMSLLKSKLKTLMIAGQKKELSELRTKVKPEWGSQIRSYVLNPYKKVKDHRTGAESSQPDKVLEGDLDKFIEAELQL